MTRRDRSVGWLAWDGRGCCLSPVDGDLTSGGRRRCLEDVSGPGDSERERRRARREFIQRHHPDRGGDPEDFVNGLRLHAVGPDPARPPIQFYRRRRGLAALWNHLERRLQRRARPGPRVR